MPPPAEASPQIANELVRLLDGSLRVEDFVATVVHEAAQPLAVIQVLASGLREAGDELDSAQRTEMLREIEHQARFLGNLAQWMVQPFARESIALDELVERAVDGCRTLADGHELIFEAGGGALTVECETVRVEASIRNLVKNAAAHSPPGSRIVVCTGAREDLAVVSVTDSGSGIPAAEWDRIFLPYARVQGERCAGTGLGLFVVRSCARQHDGDARVAASKPGRTTMELTLRALAADGAAA